MLDAYYDFWSGLIEEIHDQVDADRIKRGLLPNEWKNMSNKRKKKNRLRAEKLNAMAAREHIGSPKPTEVRSSRPGSGKVVFHETEVGSYYHISAPREERAPNQLVTSYGKIAHVAVTLPPPRTVVRPGPVKQYTSEMIANENFLRQSQGEKRVETVGQPGTIEAAVNDAKEKQRFYTKQAQSALQEAQRWEGVVAQLQGALDLVTGKTPVPRESNGTGSRPPNQFGRGHWQNFIKEKLSETSMSKNDLIQLIENSGSSHGAAYQTVFKGLKDGKLVEKEGKIYWQGD